MEHIDLFRKRAGVAANDWTIQALAVLANLGLEKLPSDAKVAYIAAFINAAALDQLAMVLRSASKDADISMRSIASSITTIARK